MISPRKRKYMQILRRATEKEIEELRKKSRIAEHTNQMQKVVRILIEKPFHSFCAFCL